MESAAFVLAVVMVTINLAIGLIAWGIREKMKTFVNHEECQKIRAGCADTRFSTTAGITEIRTDLKNLAKQYEAINQKLENIAASLGQLPDKYVTIDRLRDMIQDRG